MKFKYTIEGLGNIEKAEIDIAPFTLISGVNNSGKSFTTKSLYCILEALNDDYIANSIRENYIEIKNNFLKFQSTLKNPAKIDINFFNMFYEFLNILEMLIVQAQKDDELKVYNNDIKNFLHQIRQYIKNREKVKKFKNVMVLLKKVENYLQDLIEILDNPVGKIVESIDKNLDINFKKNFEITNLKEILNINKQKFQLEIENIGVIILDKEINRLIFKLNKNGIKEIQKLSNVIYIDSPVYTRLVKALSKRDFFYLFDDDYLKDYPLYIDKFYNFLERKYIKEPDFIELSNRIEKIINGKLEIDNSKNISYVYKNRSIPISLTAMGVTNIGIIDMLIRNNSINKGSFLIIDEPEVHLHPEWQVEFIKILYEIAKAGANVIITSHSIDVVKAIELLAKKDKENIAVNKMPYSVEFAKKSLEEKINEILDDLGSPFYNMYMQGLE